MAPPSIPNEFSVFGGESMRPDERANERACARVRELARQIARHFLRFSSFVKMRGALVPSVVE
jgi:hypothetical protein